jgi:3-oxosteroid 1-dehydrogenase
MTDHLSLQPQYDLVIIGSGGASMCAALVAKSLGRSPVILEKQAVIGGSTALSGGIMWVPNNPLLAGAGVQDSFQKGLEYLRNAVTYAGPAITLERTSAFLQAAPKMISFLQSLGLEVRRPLETWPDYYDDLPGGLSEGRGVMARPFDINELGSWKAKLADHPIMNALPMGSDEMMDLMLVKRTLKGKIKALKLAALMARDKLTGRKTVCNGGAIQGRMLQISLRHQIPIFTESPFVDFTVSGDRITGVKVRHGGSLVAVGARDAVLVNAGGFSRNGQMRHQYGREPTSGDWTSANRGDTGEVLAAMMALGAGTDCLDTAVWALTSMHTDGRWPDAARINGAVYPFMHHLDLSLPHCILVDQDGRRVCNESASYQEVGERLYERHVATGRGIPAWVIFDRRHRQRYSWGNMPPGVTPAEWIESGYMKKADTLDELARACGIDAAGLAREIARFNQFARQGKDEDFNRGGRAFDRAHGDPTVKPNPSLGVIEQGPFYAVAIFHGDVGTSGGVLTDEYARVQRDDLKVIPGLYAAGNVTASPFGRTYPGPGASIASAFTFGYIAAHHSCGSNPQ